MAAISGFRRLLRASRITFNGDTYALHQAKITLKQEFRKNRIASGSELDELLKGIEEVEEMLLFNIVQGVKTEKGNFKVKLSPDHHAVTVSASQGQDNPNGPEISPIDPSFSGGAIHVTKSTAHGRTCSAKLIEDL